jgi:predicted RNA-binding Zn-ribbon protein involved in translation (DUF1610 family)
MQISKIMEGALEGEVQCIACLTRFWPGQGAEKAKCPGCGIEWRIPRLNMRAARVRGPNWETCPTGDKI